MTKAITLEMLLTQYAHENTAPPGAFAHRGGAAGADDYDDYSGSDDGDDGADGSGGSEGEAGDGYGGGYGGGGGGGGGGGYDRQGAAAGMAAHAVAAYGGYDAVPAAAAGGAYGGAYSYAAAAGAAAGPSGLPHFPHPHLSQLRVQTGPHASVCASAGTMFSDEDCCETYWQPTALSPPGVHGTGVSPYPRGPSDLDGTGQKDVIQALLDEFAAAGAAAAAAAAAASAEGELDDLARAPDVDAPAGGPADSAPKRDLLARLSGAADGAASPMKRLRLGGGAAAASAFGPAPADEGNDADGELAICYADQRAGGLSTTGSGPLAAAAAVVRQPKASAAQPPAASPAAEAATAAASSPAAPAPAAAAGVTRPTITTAAPPAEWEPAAMPLQTPSAAGPLGLLEALPSSVRGCLADAAGLYLANDASGLAA
jgi:hypothetical protein